MDLKRVFILNLKKFRKRKGISQLQLALMCDTGTNYIGEIEMGRRFPSLKLIEKIGEVLEVEPYRFFMAETGTGGNDMDEAVNFLSRLPDKARLDVINRISLSAE
jgi:transcriptional regulator with XRE-family HTH domain